ncbi:MAG: hypothetical protein P8L77_00780 [Gammaproteobacteria bacterium]|nr:hypothetical protein [Gammaproteobacteria bacterium]
MLTKSRSGLSVPKHLNSRYFLDLMNYIIHVSHIAIEYTRTSTESDVRSEISGTTDVEDPKPEEFKSHLIYFLGTGISFLKSIGLAYLRVHQSSLDSEYVFSVTDFATVSEASLNETLIKNLLELGHFQIKDANLNLFSRDNIRLHLGTKKEELELTNINMEFEVLIGSLVLIRTLGTEDEQEDVLHAAELLNKLITNPATATMPSGFNMEDIIQMFKSSRLAKQGVVSTISKFSSKQKAFLPLLESNLFKVGKPRKTLLYPISVGYGDFNDVEKMKSSLEELQDLPFNGQYIFFVSDTWHQFTYNAKKSFDDIFYKTEDPLTSYAEKATQEGFDWIQSNKEIIALLNSNKNPSQKDEISDTSFFSTISGGSYLSDTSCDEESDEKDDGIRVDIPRCDFFDPATNYLKSHSFDIIATSEIYDQFPSLSFPEETFTNDRTTPKIRAFQLAYFIFLLGKFIYIGELIKKDQPSTQCTDIDKFLFPSHLLDKDQLQSYFNALHSHLSEYSHFITLRENLSFYSGAKKVFQFISSSSTKMLTKDCTLFKNKAELTASIISSKDRTLSFYKAQQESCKYSIFTMSMVIYFSYTYNLGNQCYPGQINGWWEELIKINQELKKERLGSTLFRSPYKSTNSSVSGTPPRSNDSSYCSSKTSSESGSPPEKEKPILENFFSAGTMSHGHMTKEESKDLIVCNRSHMKFFK